MSTKICEKYNRSSIHHLTIDEISNNIFAGGTPSTKNKNFYDGNINWLRSGEIKFNEINSTEQKISKLGLDNSSAKMVKKNSVVIALTGATVARCGWTNIELCTNQSVCSIEVNSKINYKFLYYYLSSKYNYLKTLSKGVLTSITLKDIKNLKVPIPSLEVQSQIVNILDELTKYQAELEAELVLRKKQYEYYRNKLLNFKGKDNVQYLTINDLCEIKRGERITKKDLIGDGQYLAISGGTNPFGKINKFNRNENTITIAQYGSAGFVNLQKEKFWANDVVYSIFPNTNIVNNKFLYYCLKNKQEYIYTLTTKALPNHLPLENLLRIKISIPPISIQEQIVEILDKFSALINDINNGLPKEIELRKKQYEYYRNKLLIFE